MRCIFILNTLIWFTYESLCRFSHPLLDLLIAGETFPKSHCRRKSKAILSRPWGQTPGWRRSRCSRHNQRPGSSREFAQCCWRAKSGNEINISTLSDKSTQCLRRICYHHDFHEPGTKKIFCKIHATFIVLGHLPQQSRSYRIWLPYVADQIHA